MGAVHGTAFLLIHHLCKRDAGSLKGAELMEWLIRGSGVRALVNQTDVRLAMAPISGGVLLRGHLRTHGEVGPFYLRRVRNESGEPVGYEQGIDDPVLAKLPEWFSFKQARMCYGKSDDSANRWLKKLIERGLVQKAGRAYRKLPMLRK